MLGVELWNDSWLSISCCEPPFVLSTLRVYFDAVPDYDNQTPWFPSKNDGDYTSTVASTLWQQLYISVDQRHWSLTTQDFPTAMWGKSRILECQSHTHGLRSFQRILCHQGDAPLLADGPNSNMLPFREERDILALCSWTEGGFPEVGQIPEKNDTFPGHCRGFCQSQLEESGRFDLLQMTAAS